MGSPDGTTAGFAMLFLMYGNLLLGIPCVLILWLLNLFRYWPPCRWLRDAVVPLSWIVLLNSIWWKVVDPFHIVKGSTPLTYLWEIPKAFAWFQLLGLGLLIAKAFRARRNRRDDNGSLDVVPQDGPMRRRFRSALVLLSWAVALNAFWLPLSNLDAAPGDKGVIGYLSRILAWIVLLGFGLLIASAVRTRGSVGPGKWFLITAQTVFIAVSLLCSYLLLQYPAAFSGNP